MSVSVIVQCEGQTGRRCVTGHSDFVGRWIPEANRRGKHVFGVAGHLSSVHLSGSFKSVDERRDSQSLLGPFRSLPPTSPPKAQTVKGRGARAWEALAQLELDVIKKGCQLSTRLTQLTEQFWGCGTDGEPCCNGRLKGEEADGIGSGRQMENRQGRAEC